MRLPIDDIVKHRLIDRAEISVAVTYMLANGIPEDRIAIELVRLFYVDIDELNAVMAQQAEAVPHPETLRRVA